MSELEVGEIRHALKVAQKHGFQHVSIRANDSKFEAVLPSNEAEEFEYEEHDSSDSPLATLPEESSDEITVCAPGVGYFSHGKRALKVGDQVEADGPVGEIRALGIGNEVISSVSGEVIELFVEEGDAVEFGQPLVKVKKS